MSVAAVKSLLIEQLLKNLTEEENIRTEDLSERCFFLTNGREEAKLTLFLDKKSNPSVGLVIRTPNAPKAWTFEQPQIRPTYESRAGGPSAMAKALAVKILWRWRAYRDGTPGAFAEVEFVQICPRCQKEFGAARDEECPYC